MCPLRSERWFARDDEVALLHRAALRSASPTWRPGRPVIGIADSSSDLNGCNLPLRALLPEVRAAVEEAGGSAFVFPVMPLRDATGGRVRVFEGTGGIALIDNFRRGILGTMPAVDLVWAVRAVWDALVAGDFDRAYAVSGPLCALITLQSELDAFVALEKYLLVRQGVFTSAAQRGPVGYVPDPETLAEVDRLFERLRTAVDTASNAPSAVGG